MDLQSGTFSADLTHNRSCWIKGADWHAARFVNSYNISSYNYHELPQVCVRKGFPFALKDFSRKEILCGLSKLDKQAVENL